MRSVFNPDLRVLFNFITDTVNRPGISTPDKHGRFSVEIFYGEARFLCQMMFPGYSKAVTISATYENQKKMKLTIFQFCIK